MHNCAPSQYLRLYRTICDPTDCSLPVSSIHGIHKQEYWSTLACPPLGDPSPPRFEPGASCVFCITGEFFTPGPLGKPIYIIHNIH